MAKSSAESTRIPTGYSESTTGDSAKLCWARWPPFLAGLILIPWLICWSIFTPLVWSSYLYDDATWSSDGEPASLGDAIGFTFFWFFGFSLFCYLYLRRESYFIGDGLFQRKNGCSFLYFETSALLDAINSVRHRTEDIQTESCRSPRTIDYITVDGTLEQTLYLHCLGIKIPLRYNDRRSCEMLLDDRCLARYIWDSFKTRTKIPLESTDAGYADG